MIITVKRPNDEVESQRQNTRACHGGAVKELEDRWERAFNDPDKQRKNLVSIELELQRPLLLLEAVVVVVQVKKFGLPHSVTVGELGFGMFRKGALMSRSISSKFIHLSKLVILICPANKLNQYWLPPNTDNNHCHITPHVHLIIRDELDSFFIILVFRLGYLDRNQNLAKDD